MAEELLDWIRQVAMEPLFLKMPGPLQEAESGWQGLQLEEQR